MARNNKKESSVLMMRRGQRKSIRISENKSLANKKPKVLIANDEAMQLYILQVLFLKHDFEVTTAINGHEAYEIVSQSLKN